MEFYYQIKRKLAEPEASFFGGVQNWEFPPCYSNKIEAKNIV